MSNCSNLSVVLLSFLFNDKFTQKKASKSQKPIKMSISRHYHSLFNLCAQNSVSHTVAQDLQSRKTSKAKPVLKQANISDFLHDGSSVFPSHPVLRYLLLAEDNLFQASQMLTQEPLWAHWTTSFSPWNDLITYNFLCALLVAYHFLPSCIKSAKIKVYRVSIQQRKNYKVSSDSSLSQKI